MAATPSFAGGKSSPSSHEALRGSMKMRANMIANYVGQGWTALMGLFFAPIYIQLLGIEAYGLIGFFTMLQVWLSLLDLGIVPTAVREMARFTSGAVTVERTRDLLRSFELICGAIAVALALALWVLAEFVATYWLNAGALPPSTVADAVALMGVVLGTRLVEGLYRSCLIGLQRQVWLNVATAALATARSAGAVGLLIGVDKSIQLFFLWQAAISLLTVATFAVATYRALPRPARPAHFSREALAGVGRFAASMLGINLLAILLTQVDKLLLSSLLPLRDYGFYMLASTVVGALYMFTGPITQAIYPVLVERHGAEDRAGFAYSFHQGAGLVSAILSPMAIALALFARPALFVWSGDAELADAAAPILSLLAIGTLANVLMQMPYYAQLAHGWTRFALKVNIFAVTVLVPTLMVLVPRFGVEAAAAIWATLNLFYITLAPFVFQRIMPGEMLRWYLEDLAKPLLAATIVLAAARLLWHFEDPNRWVQGGALVLIGAAALTAALATLRIVRATIRRVYVARVSRL